AFLGYSGSSDFLEAVVKTRKNVLKIFHSILGIKDEKSRPAKIPEFNFDNKLRAEKDLLFLREGKGLLGQKEFDKSTTESFRNIEGNLFKYFKKSANPDLVLQNFVRIIKSDDFPSIWYSAFTDEKFFKSFLNVCEYSQRSVDLFAEDKELKEFFLTKRVFEKIDAPGIIKWGTKKVLFLLSVQHILKLLAAPKLSELLSRYFSARINNISVQEFKKEPGNYFIAGMGSFGSEEMIFASDIDLIFSVKGLERKSYLQKDFQNLLLKFKEIFKPFDADCRLRPEGKSSLLAWDLESYKNYIKTRARIWELQSLCKINFVSGNEKMFGSFADAVVKRIESEDKEKIKSEIKEMRKKLYSQRLGVLNSQRRILDLKKAPGGLADIDFLLQFLTLADPGIFEKLRGKGTLKSISLLERQGKHASLDRLKSNFLFFKELQAANQNIFNATSSILPNDEKKNRIIAQWMGFHSQEDLHHEISKALKSNLTVFDQYFR
ncbi:MAG TPA: hypothetical protein VMT35_12085, partial [Ignavibacteriaceae bacterium]|nr:hypothetical protein [Ignavibacteriaceae bacterium]